MSALRPFEIEVVRLLASEKLSDAQRASLADVPCAATTYEYTGYGYYLTIPHESLPAESKTLDTPYIIGWCGDVRVGFVVHLGARELVLQCYKWGKGDVLPDFRDKAVAVRLLRADEVLIINRPGISGDS